MRKFSKAIKPVKNFYLSQKIYIKNALFWVGGSIALLWISEIFFAKACLPGESAVACLRQWQGMFAAAAALFIASITWKYSRENLNQSVKLFFYNQQERCGDIYYKDLEILDRFIAEYIACHTHVIMHFEDVNQPLINLYTDRLNRLSFPPWPDVQYEIYYSTCLDEYKDHFKKALEIRKSNKDEFFERFTRVIGIFQHLMSKIEETKKRRKDIYDKEISRLTL